jgi:hypothetical protein
MSTISVPQVPEVTIREATDSDEEGLRRLAQRDSAPVPPRPLVIGEVDGEIRAAISVASGATIADPFKRTADVVALVHARADQLRRRRTLRSRVVARTPAPTPATASARLRAAA